MRFYYDLRHEYLNKLNLCVEGILKLKIIILAATGRIADKLIPKLLEGNELTLFGHNVTERLRQYADQANLIDGDLTNENAVKKAAEGQKLAVLNFMAGTVIAQHVVDALKDTSCKRLVVTTGHCSPDETNGGKTFSNSSLKTTCIYMPWIRDNSGKSNYQIIPDDPQAEDVNQVSHEEVAKFIADLVKNPDQYTDAEISLKEI